MSSSCQNSFIKEARIKSIRKLTGKVNNYKNGLNGWFLLEPKVFGVSAEQSGDSGVQQMEYTN
jgi:hypothetical protein